MKPPELPLAPTALLFVQAGMIMSVTAAFAWPAMMLGLAQAITAPRD